VNGIQGTKSGRLDSWKEIAAYLGRDVRTAIRWEKERGLPVHRETSGPGRPTVFALVEELDRWMMGHRGESQVESAAESADPAKAPVRPRRVLRAVLYFGLALLVSVGGVFLVRDLIERASDRHLQFARSDFPAAGPMSVGVADFDRDGNLDIVFTNAATNTIDVLFGDGRGEFKRRVSMSSAREPERLAIADMNGDSIPDLAITHRNSHDVSVMLGDGQGGFRESFRWPTKGRSRWVTATDINGDKNPDLVVACSAAQKVLVLLGRGDGTFERGQEYEANGEPSAALVGDFNHDGIPDVMTADYQVAGGTTVSLFAGNGDGSLKPRKWFRTGFGPLAATAADYNGDGFLDVATADFHDGMSVLLATDKGFAPPRTHTVASAPGFVASGDFDGDGKLDIVLVAEHSNDAQIFYGDGLGGFRVQKFDTGGYPDSVAVGDFNKDGRLDFVVGAVYGNMVSVYLNKGPQP